MKRALAGPIRRMWQGEDSLLSAILFPVTLPLSLVFGTGVRVRNALFDLGLRRVHRGPVPVISVGNVTVGGTGKTPVSRWLVERLGRAGIRPALVTRGYGDDELALHRRWNPEVPVVAHRDRVRAVRQAHREGAAMAVVDDGFQHRRLHRDVDIALLSPLDPFPPRLLPRGPYREPLRALRRADLILVPWRTPDEGRRARRLAEELGRAPGFPPVHTFGFAPGPWQRLDGGPAAAPEGPVVVLTSVAKPESVVALVRQTGLESVEILAYPDHHPYREADVKRIRERAGGRTVVTTEKDAVKLEAFAEVLGPVVVLPLRPVPGAAVAAAVDALVSDLVGRETPGDAPRVGGTEG